MAEHTGIEWTDATFSPWLGCQKLSAGCDNCWAERLDTMNGGTHWTQRAARQIVAETTWSKPVQWNRKVAALGHRMKVLCGSVCDVFELNTEVPGLETARARLWTLIDSTPNLAWLLLTKRPQYIEGMVPLKWLRASRWPRNCFCGVSVENSNFKKRIDCLLRVPAPLLFVSCEPLLGRLDLDAYLKPNGRGRSIGWIIAGGENGWGVRPSHPDWFRLLRDQCRSAGVPFFFKTWGSATKLAHGMKSDLLDGEVCRDYPTQLLERFQEQQLLPGLVSP